MFYASNLRLYILIYISRNYPNLAIIRQTQTDLNHIEARQTFIDIKYKSLLFTVKV